MGYASGINEQTGDLFADLFGPNFSNEPGYARWRNAMAGAAIGFGGTKLLMKYNPELRQKAAHWFVPDLGIEDAMRYEKARIGPRKRKMIEDEINPLEKKISETVNKIDDPMQRKAVSELTYKMVTQGPKASRDLITGTSSDDTMNALAEQLMKDSPELISMGERCLSAGFSYIWVCDKFPCFLSLGGRFIIIL